MLETLYAWMYWRKKKVGLTSNFQKKQFIAYAEDKDIHTDVIFALEKSGADSVALYLTYIIMVMPTV